MEGWVPKTKIGRLVSEGAIKSIDEILALGVPIREVEIVDILLPDLEEELIDIRTVQRQTDAGEVSSLRVVVAVGDRNGHIGVAKGKGKTFRNAVQEAIIRAKLNICYVRRGCGSWECACGLPHSLPFKVTGSSGSVRVKIFPAPSGLGIVANETGRTLLSLAGISDARVFSRGNTANKLNYAKAIYDALRKTTQQSLFKGVKVEA